MFLNILGREQLISQSIAMGEASLSEIFRYWSQLRNNAKKEVKGKPLHFSVSFSLFRLALSQNLALTFPKPSCWGWACVVCLFVSKLLFKSSISDVLKHLYALEVVIAVSGRDSGQFWSRE